MSKKPTNSQHNYLQCYGDKKKWTGEKNTVHIIRVSSVWKINQIDVCACKSTLCNNCIVPKKDFFNVQYKTTENHLAKSLKSHTYNNISSSKKTKSNWVEKKKKIKIDRIVQMMQCTRETEKIDLQRPILLTSHELCSQHDFLYALHIIFGAFSTL